MGMQANDWEAGNLDASTTSDDPPSNFAGYDAVNRYGDEVLVGGNDYSSDPINYPGLGRIYRTGYMEKDIENWKKIKISKLMAKKAKQEKERLDKLKSQDNIDDIEDNDLFD
mgnify:CR=1 FL=1